MSPSSFCPLSVSFLGNLLYKFVDSVCTFFIVSFVVLFRSVQTIFVKRCQCTAFQNSTDIAAFWSNSCPPSFLPSFSSVLSYIPIVHMFLLVDRK